MVKVRDKNPRVFKNRTEEELTFIKKAFELIQSRTGEHCLEQGLRAAEILDELGLDATSLVAAIVFDAYRYGYIPCAKILEQLGSDVVELILEVQKIDAINKQGIVRHTENLRRMLLAIVKDIRVVLIKLSFHTIEMQDALHLTEPERLQMGEITQKIYAPLANRLGIGQIKWELEDLAFRFLEPKTYKQIALLLNERRVDRENDINKMVAEVQDVLTAQGIKANVFGRPKHIYSIWKKMQRKQIGYHEIYDIRAIRILVQNIHECYAALGLIHELWQPISKEFDDYIANPKSNGYRSLHTAVVAPDGKTLEVQIRTPEMHDQAELGVSAHWRYKENIKRDVRYETKLASLRQILKWQEEWSFDTEFQDRVYALTPKGEVFDLPSGATVLDFAYYIHSDIGHRCRGAKVNDRIVPLTHALKNSDTVEILTTKEAGPSRDWLNGDLGFLKTSRAKSKVRHWFKSQGPVVTSTLQEVPMAVQKKHVNRMLNSHSIKEKIAANIIVSGVGHLLCQMALCCKPTLGEDIMGYITVGRGISIHRKECINLHKAGENKPDRLIEVEWN